MELLEHHAHTAANLIHPAAFGGGGYTAAEMKSAFDRLPILLAERYNSLLEDAEALGEGSLAASIPTGISEEHTLANLFSDVKNGNLASHLTVGEESLYSVINRLLRAAGFEVIDLA